MKYEDFRKMMMNRPFFTSKDISGIGPLKNTMKLQLSRWSQQGKIIKLKKGVYTLNDMDRNTDLSPYLLCEELYSPSYVSLESALSYYQLIPEAVNSFTCITTNKTKTFKNKYGVFFYRSLKKDLFFGFKKNRSPDNNHYFLAVPEKAVLDFVYYNIPSSVQNIRSVLNDNYRFQNLDILDMKVLNEYADKFKLKKVDNVLMILKGLIKEWK